MTQRKILPLVIDLVQGRECTRLDWSPEMTDLFLTREKSTGARFLAAQIHPRPNIACDPASLKKGQGYSHHSLHTHPDVLSFFGRIMLNAPVFRECRSGLGHTPLAEFAAGLVWPIEGRGTYTQAGKLETLLETDTQTWVHQTGVSYLPKSLNTAAPLKDFIYAYEDVIKGEPFRPNPEALPLLKQMDQDAAIMVVASPELGSDISAHHRLAVLGDIYTWARTALVLSRPNRRPSERRMAEEEDVLSPIQLGQYLLV